MNIDLLARRFEDDTTPLFRTDFSDDAAWERVVAELAKPVDFGGEDPDADDLEDGEGYSPTVEAVQDRSFEGPSADTIAAQWERDRQQTGYVLLADAQSMSEATAGTDPTVVYVDLSVSETDQEEFGDVYGRSFRCVASEVASIEANLSIANMDFSEFADHADSQGGVFRGFDD